MKLIFPSTPEFFDGVELPEENLTLFVTSFVALKLKYHTIHHKATSMKSDHNGLIVPKFLNLSANKKVAPDALALFDILFALRKFVLFLAV